jgi:hypothetical protein
MAIILVSYQTCLKNRLSLAFQILMILFLNELGVSLSKLIRYCNMNNVILCSLSLILATGFNVAASIHKPKLRLLDMLHLTCSRQRVYSTRPSNQHLESHDTQYSVDLPALHMHLCTHWNYS